MRVYQSAGAADFAICSRRGGGLLFPRQVTKRRTMDKTFRRFRLGQSLSRSAKTETADCEGRAVAFVPLGRVPPGPYARGPAGY